MGRVWTATPDISFTLTEEEIKTDKRCQRFFKDTNNPTEAEVRKYFDSPRH